MKAIKVLVLFMAIVLVVGFGFLIWGLSGGARVSSPHLVAKTPSESATAAAFGLIKVDLPPGSKVDQVLSAGDKIVVRVIGGGTDRLLVMDPISGNVSGGFDLEPAH